MRSIGAPVAIVGALILMVLFFAGIRAAAVAEDESR
jgi:hypothetical protein